MALGLIAGRFIVDYVPGLDDVDHGPPHPAQVRVDTTRPSIHGHPTVVDGDTLRFGATRVRLWGIDAPESDQTCTINQAQVPIGQHATNHLMRLVGASPVSCYETGRDPYDRALAVCTVNGADINEAMVRDGHAFAYRAYARAYISPELDAYRGLHGMWACPILETPWIYRAQKRQR